MSTPAKVEAAPSPATLNDVLIRGDLSKLTEPQRTEYYLNVCRSLGLNPLTQPFAYLTLSGKLVLYAKRDAADQLRKINGISIEIVSQQTVNDLLTVHARAKDRDGRTDEDFGVVPLKGGGEFAANAIMKAVTKAKRRVTLSISGLGFLDETEVGAADESNEPDYKLVSPDQLDQLIAVADDLGVDKRVFVQFLAARWHMPVASMAAIPADHFEDAMVQLERKRKAIEDGDAQGEALL